ncbi:MAG: metal-dependent hydrolase [Bdellovibrionota bacterium]
MKGTTHLVTGIGLGLILGNLFQTPYDINGETMLGASLGALFPDIDTGGLIARPGKLMSVRNRNTRKIFDTTGDFISKIIQSFTTHRGFFHWPINAIIFIVIGAFTLSPFAFYFGVGYLSHCLLDALNAKGVPLFAPISLDKYRIARLKYGGIGERIYLILLALFILYFLKGDLMTYLEAVNYG